jgi:hypothetical protein
VYSYSFIMDDSITYYIHNISLVYTYRRHENNCNANVLAINVWMLHASIDNKTT